MAPLFAAGFTTAFGAHAVAASLGTERSLSLLGLGVVVAAYDVAEVVFKPVFGTWADTVGPRRILLGGLAGFALASAAGALLVPGGDVAGLAVVRLAQGTAASAFSPAASAMVAALRPATAGGAFGGYGALKSLGHALGPLVGGVLVWAGGFPALFTVLALLAAVVALWIALAVPRVAPVPRARQTVLDLARRVTTPDFLAPTLVLAATAGALSVGVGYLPVLGTRAGLSPVLTGAVVSLLAVAAAAVQPWAGRAYDRRDLTLRAGIVVGLGLIALGATLAATAPLWGTVAGTVGAAVAIGLGVGLATPVGFAAVAASAPTGRLGQTMGAAEVGRETGDAAGPLLVGAVAGAASLAAGLAAFAAVTVLVVAATLRTTRPRPDGARGGSP
ncbi:MFS transporter [Georgenia thermotolerans]|uniref:MFS transporter n=1 Tax=Georgenia thermotolerans TaxID=527326 RepID=A0A7J5UIZ0_9MICO|nr:MFS transporter [Georgenia thermotolerans]